MIPEFFLPVDEVTVSVAVDGVSKKRKVINSLKFVSKDQLFD
jgi:hypothetical protein